MLKKIISLILVVAITASISITGTMAYLQHEDSDVNVMTLGNVTIEQHEYERAIEDGNFVTYTETERDGSPTGYKLTDFKQAKPLMPATGAVTGWDETRVYFAQLPDESTMGAMDVLAGLNNVQDKFVFVENTGKSDAYVRTLIAFEAGSIATEEEFDELVMTCNHDFWDVESIGFIKIDDNNYLVYEYNYTGAEGANGKHPDGIVHPGEYTYCNLSQVYMTSKATNEDVEAIDGNDNGTYDILVLSQAVQAAGFEDAVTALDTAFGKSSENAAEWFGGEEFEIPVLVSGEEEFAAALADGRNIVLTSDIALTEALTASEEIKLDLNGHTLSTVGLTLGNGGVIEDGTVTSAANTEMVPHLKVSGGKVTMNNVVIDVVHHLNANVYWSEAIGLEITDATAVLNNCDIKVSNTTNARWVYSYGISITNTQLTMNEGSISAYCVDGTASAGPTNPNAVCSIGDCTVTMNNVEVDAVYYASTVNGHLTINTTDTNITSDNIVDNRGGSHVVNYI